MDSKKMVDVQISAVICTYNRADILQGAIQSLCQQTLDSSAFEIIVVDNASRDHTAAVVVAFQREYPHLTLRYVLETQQGLSYARNRGWQEAQGVYVAYLDDDAKAPPNWLATAEAIVKNERPAIFGGPYVPFYRSPKPLWFKDIYETFQAPEKYHHIKALEFMIFGGNMFLQRAILEEYGGFNPDYGMVGEKIAYGEEIEFFQRVWLTKPDIPMYYSADLQIEHLVKPERMDLRKNCRQRFILGRYLARSEHQSQHLTLSRWYGLYRLLKMVPILIRSAGRMMLRNRQQYPFWQNYFYEEILAQIQYIGWLYEVVTDQDRKSIR